MREIRVQTPDGKSRVIPLGTTPISFGRSDTSDHSFPDDTGLSRRHFSIEPEAGGWVIADLGSKNGTTLNGTKVAGRAPLQSGDRIVAGHLILTIDSRISRLSEPVVTFEGTREQDTSSATVVTTLEGIIRADQKSGEAKLAGAHVSALIRAGNELASQRPLEELFPFILDLAIETVKADRGVLMTLEHGELTMVAHKGEGFRISTGVRDRVLRSGSSILIRDTSLDEALRGRESIVAQNVRTLMAVPLQTGEAVIGLIYVDSPPVLREFTEEDLNVLTVLANVAAVRIEHTRLAEVEQNRKLLARDLDQAAEIQKQYLPGKPPAIQGIDLAGHNVACRTVGGDYYEFFPYGPNRLGMVLGDVSGKGMPASLLMMGLQARMQVLTKEEPADLAEAITRLNFLTCDHCPANRFITLFFCILDSATGELHYCNAGHNPPLLVRKDGSHLELSGGGPVVGILPFIQYESCRVQMEAGDTLVIYTDGVTEAADQAGEEFEVEHLLPIIRTHRTESSAAVIAAVNEGIEKFTAGAPQTDDITMIVARRV